MSAVQSSITDPSRGAGDTSGQIPQIDPLFDSSGDEVAVIGPLDIFHGYFGVFIIAFLVALLTAPVMRWIAMRQGIVDYPDDLRKGHKRPVAYLGGVAVFLGIASGIVFSYVAPELPAPLDQLIQLHEAQYEGGKGVFPQPVPLSVLLGMTIVLVLGLIDDTVGTIPRLKIAGMLVAAAALAWENVGVELARGLLAPTLGTMLGNEELLFHIPLPFSLGGADVMQINLIYWAGAAIIAIFVIGGCNAANLVDGLDGLLSGVTAIATVGLLVIALTLLVTDEGSHNAQGQGIILSMALLGACLGFLPHNFRPASIFLGDAGSLLMGFTIIVIILTLGDTGRTQLVVAGLVIYAIPIIDTVLAIVRRKLAGKSISGADDQHLHHMLRRHLGVQGAVFALYAIGAGFAILGVLMTLWRARVIYALALIFASYIVVVAIKVARRQQIEQAPVEARKPRKAKAGDTPSNERDDEPVGGGTGK